MTQHEFATVYFPLSSLYMVGLLGSLNARDWFRDEIRRDAFRITIPSGILRSKPEINVPNAVLPHVDLVSSFCEFWLVLLSNHSASLLRKQPRDGLTA